MDLEEQVDNDSCDPDENHVQSGDGDGLATAKWTNLKKKAFGFSSHISSAFKRCSLGILRRQHQYGMIQPSSHRSFTLDILRVGRSVILSSYINFLLVFVPIGFATYTAKVPSPWIFATNAIAIVPLSALLTDATERIASEAGDTIGSLLNISLGNAVELILLWVCCVSSILRWTDLCSQHVSLSERSRFLRQRSGNSETTAWL